MADIDKGLPNTRTKIEIPSEEEMAKEVSVQEEDVEKGPVEVDQKKMVVQRLTLNQVQLTYLEQNHILIT